MLVMNRRLARWSTGYAAVLSIASANLSYVGRNKRPYLNARTQ